MALAVNLIHGRDPSNKMYCQLQSKKTKVVVLLYFGLTFCQIKQKFVQIIALKVEL